MNAKQIIAVLAVVIVAGLIIAYVSPVVSPPPKEDIEQPDYVDPKVLEGAALPEPVPAIEGQNFSGEDCESNPVQEDRDYCYVIQADNEGRLEPCLKISALAEKNICIKAIAINTGKTAFCNYMESAFNPNDNSNVKYSCITAVAIDAADETICTQIPDSGWKEKCIEFVQQETPQ